MLSGTQPNGGGLSQSPPHYLQILASYEGIDPERVRLSVGEAAQITGLAPKTLEAMRAQGRGPAFMKIGGRVKYRLADVLEYLDASVFRSTREAKTASQLGGRHGA